MTSTDTMTIQVVPLKDALTEAKQKYPQPYQARPKAALTLDERARRNKIYKARYFEKLKNDPERLERLKVKPPRTSNRILSIEPTSAGTTQEYPLTAYHAKQAEPLIPLVKQALEERGFPARIRRNTIMWDLLDKYGNGITNNNPRTFKRAVSDAIKQNGYIKFKKAGGNANSVWERDDIHRGEL